MKKLYHIISLFLVLCCYTLVGVINNTDQWTSLIQEGLGHQIRSSAGATSPLDSRPAWRTQKCTSSAVRNSDLVIYLAESVNLEFSQLLVIAVLPSIDDAIETGIKLIRPSRAPPLA